MSAAAKSALWLLGGAVGVAGIVDEQLLWSRVRIDGEVPQGREFIAAAVFPENEQFYMYGGFNYDAERRYLEDLWRFDLNSMTWKEIEAGGDRLGPRESYFCAAFEARDRFLLFGGSSQAGRHNDLWSFDVSSSNWTELVVAGDKPAPQQDGITATFPDKGVFFVHGGGYSTAESDELWHFSLETNIWSQVVITGPRPRYNHGVATFADAGFFLVYGGRGQLGMYYDDLWKIDVDLADSTKVTATLVATTDVNTRPAARYGMGIATFQAAGYFVLYGGFNGERLGDTWRFDLSTDRWEEYFVGDAAPASRFNFAVATFEADELFYIYGGYDGRHVNEMWTLGNGTTTTSTRSSTTTLTTTTTVTTVTVPVTTVTAAPLEGGFSWGTVVLVVFLLVAFAGGGFFLGSRLQERETGLPSQADSSEVELIAAAVAPALSAVPPPAGVVRQDSVVV